MTTRADLRTTIGLKLNDPGGAIWDTSHVNAFIGAAIKGLYPYYYQRQVGTTSASAGPLQNMPNGARNLYMVGYLPAGASRVRALRQWSEGDGTANIPKIGITGATVVWAWTSGWDAPTSDTQVLSIPIEAEELVIVKSEIAALEMLLANRGSAQKYLDMHVKEDVTMVDLIDTLNALHATLQVLIEKAPALPVVKQ